MVELEIMKRLEKMVLQTVILLKMELVEKVAEMIMEMGMGMDRVRVLEKVVLAEVLVLI